MNAIPDFVPGTATAPSERLGGMGPCKERQRRSATGNWWRFDEWACAHARLCHRHMRYPADWNDADVIFGRLGARARHVLWRNGYHTLAAVKATSDARLLSLQNCGRITLAEIRAAVSEASARAASPREGEE